MLARMLRPHQHGNNGGERREGRNFDRDGHGWGGRRFGENGSGFPARMAKTVAAGATATCTT